MREVPDEILSTKGSSPQAFEEKGNLALPPAGVERAEDDAHVILSLVMTHHLLGTRKFFEVYHLLASRLDRVVLEKPAGTGWMRGTTRNERRTFARRFSSTGSTAS